MECKTWACPLLATVIASFLILYEIWIPANILIAIGIRRFINLIEENIDYNIVLHEV